MKKTQVARLLAYVTGMVNQQLLLQNEYLIAENRILRSHLPTRFRLTDAQRATLAAIGKRVGRQALAHVASVAKPETILAWYRKLIAQKFEGSKHRSYPGRPAIGREIAELIVPMARENSGWGYDRIAGALKNLGHDVSDQTVGNVLRRLGIAPAAKRRQQMNWAHVIRAHMAVLAGYRLLHHRSAHLARLVNLLRSLLLTPGDAPRHGRRNHSTSHGRMDGADGPECCGRDRWHLASGSLCFTRSRHKVL
jgi:hypothetical protein